MKGGPGRVSGDRDGFAFLWWLRGGKLVGVAGETDDIKLGEL